MFVVAGKSSLAQQLASRFNMPNVLQTDMFYEVCPSHWPVPCCFGFLIETCLVRYTSWRVQAAVSQLHCIGVAH